jgi:hypothetical protein
MEKIGLINNYLSEDDNDFEELNRLVNRVGEEE